MSTKYTLSIQGYQARKPINISAWEYTIHTQTANQFVAQKYDVILGLQDLNQLALTALEQGIQQLQTGSKIKVLTSSESIFNILAFALPQWQYYKKGQFQQIATSNPLWQNIFDLIQQKKHIISCVLCNTSNAKQEQDTTTDDDLTVLIQQAYQQNQHNIHIWIEANPTHQQYAAIIQSGVEQQHIDPTYHALTDHYALLLTGLTEALQKVPVGHTEKSITVHSSCAQLHSDIQNWLPKYAQNHIQALISLDKPYQRLWLHIAELLQERTVQSQLIDDNTPSKFYTRLVDQLNKPIKPTHPTVNIWTDGSFKPQTKQGSWSARIEYEGQKEPIKIGGSVPNAHSNVCMEFMAVTKALEKLESHSIVTVYTDFKLIADCARIYFDAYDSKQGPLTKNVTNQDRQRMIQLWLDLYTQDRRHTKVQYKWVKGHSTNAKNNEVDKLASFIRTSN